MFGELSKEKIEEVLHGQVVGRIGCHADGTTYIVPISYAYDGKYIYGHTQEGMKVTMMRKNRVVCFEVDNLQNMANWQSVIGWGEYEELKDGPDRQAALQKLHERILPMVASATTRISPEWPFAPNDMNSIKGVVFRIGMTRITGRFENNDIPSFLYWG
jgi:nitroimidazol reductase NimA-like FMN-containing flavoprotein (pyridoxamine 5'-phosphate oxidase superfamily)